MQKNIGKGSKKYSKLVWERHLQIASDNLLYCISLLTGTEQPVRHRTAPQQAILHNAKAEQILTSTQYQMSHLFGLIFCLCSWWKYVSIFKRQHIHLDRLKKNQRKAG